MKKAKKIVALLMALVILAGVVSVQIFTASADNYVTVRNYDDWYTEISKRDVLSPGKIDYMTDNTYGFRMLRSLSHPAYISGGVYYTHDTIDKAMKTYLATSYSNSGFSNPLGSMLGISNKALTASLSYSCNWNAQTMCYRVEPNTFIATALLYKSCTVGYEETLWNSYGFEYSADGRLWTPLTPTFDEEMQWTQNVNFMTVVKAVSKMPADAKYYRVTMPFYNKSSAGISLFADGTYTPLVYPFGNAALFTVEDIQSPGIGFSVASSYDLSKYDTLADVPAESDEHKAFLAALGTKKTLSAGVIDDLTTDNYAYKMVLDSSKSVNDVTATALASNYASYTAPYGNIMGINNKAVFAAKTTADLGAGVAAVYRTMPNVYIATSLTYYKYSGDILSKYRFEYSTDGYSWSSLTPTFKTDAEADATGGKLTSVKAVLKMPADANYYRIVAPFYNETVPAEAATLAATDVGVGAAGIGTTIVSSANLANYDKFSDVPVEPLDKSELEEYVHRCSVVKTVSLKEGEVKNRFIAAYAEAERLVNALSASQLEVDEAATALRNAFLILEYKDVNGTPIFDEIPDELKGHANQYNDRYFLKPGIYDELLASPYYAAGDTALQGTFSSAYPAHVGMYSAPGVYVTAAKSNNWYYMILNRSDHKYSAVDFMGKPIGAVYFPASSWSGNYVQYRVYENSYISTALVMNKSQSAHGIADIHEKYYYMVSKDGVNYELVTPLEVKLVDNCDATADGLITTSLNVYKATVKIPEGYTYYRIMAPGIKELDVNSQWYTPNPSGGDVSIGPSMASKYDLTQYDNYADVPDYTPEYSEPSVKSYDESKVDLTNKAVVGVLKDGMTAADVKAAAPVTNGSWHFTDADGNPISDSTVLVSGMRASLYDTGDNDFSKATTGETMLVLKYNHIYMMDVLTPVTAVCGSEKTAETLNLPATATFYSGKGAVKAEITWDVANANYNPKVTQTQKFTVKGKVTLPNGISNPLSVPLDVTIDVTVNEPVIPGVRAKEDATKIEVDMNARIVYYTEGMTAGEFLDSIEAFGNVKYKLTRLDTNKDEIVEVDRNEKINSFMGIDVYDAVYDYHLTYFNLINIHNAPADIGLEDVPTTGEKSPVLPIVLVLCAVAAFVFALIFLKRQKAN